MKNTGRRKDAARFLLYSMFGIFMFFIQINIAGNRSIPVDHLIGWLKNISGPVYGYLMFLISGGFVAARIIQRRKFENISDLLFYAQSVTGCFLCAVVLAGIGPESFLAAGKQAVNATGNILCAIFVSSVFVPFLTEYGLVEALGVLLKPFMNTLFLTPGTSAVIGVSAFLGNYSMGHVLSRQMYEEGKFTEKESVIVALGFSTCSVGLMINLVNYLDLMPYWTQYTACVLLITFAVTAVTARLYPISAKSDTCWQGAEHWKEETVHEHILSKAWETGVSQAKDAPGILPAIRSILKRVFPVICEITGTSMFVMVVGILAASYTDLFTWLGTFLRPFLHLVTSSASEIKMVSSAIGASLFEPVLAGVLGSAGEMSLKMRWVTAVVPYTSIIFFAGFIPSVRSSKVSCSVREMLLVWVERVCMSTVLAACSALLLFGRV